MKAFPIPRRPTRSPVNNQLLRLLRHFRIEIVHQHPQRRLLLPPLAGNLRPPSRSKRPFGQSPLPRPVWSHSRFLLSAPILTPRHPLLHPRAPFAPEKVAQKSPVASNTVTWPQNTFGEIMAPTKRKLGNSGLAIAPIVFGGNVFGWTADESTSFQLLDAFRCRRIQRGRYRGTFFISKWVPGNKGGESETIIGKWLKRSQKRQQVIIATKVGAENGSRKERAFQELHSGCGRRFAATLADRLPRSVSIACG